MPDPTIRWLWAVDADGQRITTAEAVTFVVCEHCGEGHPTVRPDRTMIAPLAGHTMAEVAGWASSEFFPD